MSEHEHKCGETCDCGQSDCDHDGEATVTLTLDDGTVVECVVLTIFPAGGKDYIALLPLNETGEMEEDSEVFLYRFTEKDGEPELSNIEDDDEYEIVTDAFEEFLDDEEFEELVDEDELD